MVKKTNMYRVIVGESKILEDNLTNEQANYLFEFLSFERGMSNLKIEQYYPYSHRLGRDPDLH
jgi:hypothetical protein